MILRQLALVFGILSFLSFGGGNAVIPQLHADAVEQQHWIDSAEFSRFFALARLAPGPTMQMSALIGYAVAGLAGAVVAISALFVPAALLVFWLGRVWGRLHGHPWRDRVAAGLGPVVLGLVWAGIPPVASGAIDGPATLAIAGVTTLVMLTTEVNQAVVVLGAGVLGWLAFGR